VGRAAAEAETVGEEVGGTSISGDTATADSLTEAGTATGGQLGQIPPDGDADSTTQSN
jgi:hypothetical protein